MEQHDATKMTNALKKALKAISIYKEEKDSVHKQLATQEKDIRRLRLEFSKKSKEAKSKEKKRAQAMFGGGEKNAKKDSEKPQTLTDQEPAQMPLQASSMSQMKPQKTIAEANGNKTETENVHLPTESTTSLGEIAIENGDDDDDDESSNDGDSSFFEEHSEALLILSGVAVGWFILRMVNRRNNP